MPNPLIRFPALVLIGVLLGGPQPAAGQDAELDTPAVVPIHAEGLGLYTLMLWGGPTEIIEVPESSQWLDSDSAALFLTSIYSEGEEPNTIEVSLRSTNPRVYEGAPSEIVLVIDDSEVVIPADIETPTITSGETIGMADGQAEAAIAENLAEASEIRLLVGDLYVRLTDEQLDAAREFHRLLTSRVAFREAASEYEGTKEEQGG